MPHALWTCGWHNSCYHQPGSWISFNRGPSITWNKLNSTLKGWIKDLWILSNRGFLHFIAELTASIYYYDTILTEQRCTLFSHIRENRGKEKLKKRNETPNIPPSVPTVSGGHFHAVASQNSELNP